MSVGFNRACPIKRSRRTKADVAAIRDAIVEVIEDDPPMTVRQVFYQLVDARRDREDRGAVPGHGHPADDRHAARRQPAL